MPPFFCEAGEHREDLPGIGEGANSKGFGVTPGVGSKDLVGYVRSWITALGSLPVLVSVQQEQRLKRKTDKN